MTLLDELKQFVPSSVCLECDGCCRFRRPSTRWQPCVTKDELAWVAADAAMKRTLEKTLDPDGRVRCLAYQDIFVCHFLSPSQNTCGIYHARPFECRLYPFLLTNAGGQMAVHVHLLCPYVAEHKGRLEWETYVRRLKNYFSRSDVSAFLGRNPHLAGDYQAGPEELERVFTVQPNP